jgi:hypothetical protein
VAVSCKYGDQPSGSGAMVLVAYEDNNIFYISSACYTLYEI